MSENQTDLAITRMVTEAVQEIESSGELKAVIQKAAVNAISSVLSNYFTGYDFKGKLTQRLDGCCKGLIEEIGLQSYASLVIDKFAEGIEEMAAKDAAALKEKVKMYSYWYGGDHPHTILDIIEAYERDVNDNTEEEEKIVLNNTGGYMCYVEFDHKGYCQGAMEITLYLSSDADIAPTSVVKFLRSSKRAMIGELSIDGKPLTIETMPRYPSAFEQMLIWLYLNHTYLDGDISGLDEYTQKSRLYELDE